MRRGKQLERVAIRSKSGQATLGRRYCTDLARLD